MRTASRTCRYAGVIKTVTAARLFYGVPQRRLQPKIAQALSTEEYNKIIAHPSGGSVVEVDQRRTSFLGGQGGHAGLRLLANIADPANRLPRRPVPGPRAAAPRGQPVRGAHGLRMLLKEFGRAEAARGSESPLVVHAPSTT